MGIAKLYAATITFQTLAPHTKELAKALAANADTELFMLQLTVRSVKRAASMRELLGSARLQQPERSNSAKNDKYATTSTGCYTPRMASTQGPKFEYQNIPVGYYDRILRTGGGVRRLWHTLKFDRVLDYLPEENGGSLLDIGCFAGTFLSLVPRHRFQRQVGLDILPEQVAYANHNFGTAFREFNTVERITSLGVAESEFDAVTLIEIIEHLRHDEIVGLFEELDRAVKPGGTIVVTTPNYASTWPVLEAILNKVSDVSYVEQHITRFSYFSFERQLQRILPNFDKRYAVELKTTTHLLSPFLAVASYEVARGLARAVPHRSWSLPIGNLVLVVLRKRGVAS